MEKGLLIVGGGLAIWWIGTLVQLHYFNGLPVPPQATTAPAEPAPSVIPATPAPETEPTPPKPAPPVRGAWLARIEAPEVRLAATVLEGSDDKTLDRGAGHIEDTAMPGEEGNIGIAGHRDTVFRPVRKLHVGDEIHLATRDHTYHYRVAKTLIVKPEDVYVLDPGPRPLLTLVTCYPFEFLGHAPKRYIVQAELVDTEARLTAR